MRPQQYGQARSPRRIELILVAVEDYVNVDVLIAIMIIFPLDDYGSKSNVSPNRSERSWRTIPVTRSASNKVVMKLSLKAIIVLPTVSVRWAAS